MKQSYKQLAGLAAAVFLPYLLYGFQYFPVLDDYIQYWGYPAYRDLSHVYLTIGTLATRPLASLLDPLFWGKLWPCLSVALFLITVMHLLAEQLMDKVLRRYQVPLSPFFGLVFLLLPLGMEGRFWLSASSRLVMGLFFACLSLYFLSSFLQEKKTVGSFLLFSFFQLISCGFYEAVTVFSAAFSVLLFCVSFHQKRDKHFFLVPATAVFNVSAMFIYYRLFASLGGLGSRAASVSFSALPTQLEELLHQLVEVFALAYERTVLGCFEGVRLLCRSGWWGLLILLFIVVTALFISSQKGTHVKKSRREVFLLSIGGFMLFLAPLLPNVLAADIWITNRSLFISIIGLALMAEPLFCLLGDKTRGTILFLTAFIFMTAAVNEYDLYRRVNEQDGKLLDAVIAQMSPAAKTGEEKVIVLLSEEVTVEQNAFYKDHVKSVFDSDWALTGAVRARLQSLAPKGLLPVIAGTDFDAENAQIIYIDVDSYK